MEEVFSINLLEKIAGWMYFQNAPAAGCHYDNDDRSLQLQTYPRFLFLKMSHLYPEEQPLHVFVFLLGFVSSFPFTCTGSLRVASRSGILVIQTLLLTFLVSR